MDHAVKFSGRGFVISDKLVNCTADRCSLTVALSVDIYTVAFHKVDFAVNNTVYHTGMTITAACTGRCGLKTNKNVECILCSMVRDFVQCLFQRPAFTGICSDPVTAGGIALVVIPVIGFITVLTVSSGGNAHIIKLITGHGSAIAVKGATETTATLGICTLDLSRDLCSGGPGSIDGQNNRNCNHSNHYKGKKLRKLFLHKI